MPTVNNMPGSMIERPKMTRTMYQALKKHIIRDRERKKQEKEQDEALERHRKEMELRRKREEANTLTLEQTKDQIIQCEQKLKALKQEKHQLFDKLKKVISAEEERKKAEQAKENRERERQQQAYHSLHGVTHMHGLNRGAHTIQPGAAHGAVGSQGGRPGTGGVPMSLAGARSTSKYMTSSGHAPQNMKRRRSPSPTPMYAAPPSQGKYAKQDYLHTTAPQKGSYPQSYGTHTYPPKHGQAAVSSASPGPNYHGSKSGGVTAAAPLPAGSQAGAFSSYQTGSYAHAPGGAGRAATPGGHPPPPTQPPVGGGVAAQAAAHQAKQLGDRYAPLPPQQRLAQQHAAAGYLNSPGRSGAAIPLQQQLEHANSKSGFSEDLVKRQQLELMQGHLYGGAGAGGASTNAGGSTAAQGHGVRAGGIAGIGAAVRGAATPPNAAPPPPPPPPQGAGQPVAVSGAPPHPPAAYQGAPQPTQQGTYSGSTPAARHPHAYQGQQRYY